MFTDDDCYLGEDYFQTAHQVFEGEPFSYCSGRILLYDPSDAAYGAQEQDTFEIISPHLFIPPGRFQGANLIVRRQVFDEIGLFDPVSGAGTPFRCEDIDFVARASHADFTGAHVPELVVYHHHGRKPGEDIRSLDAANNYACGAYYAKFLRRGHLSFPRGWLAEGLFLEKTYGPQFQSLFEFIRELRSAIDYLSTP